jgi:uncharacterized GH25 family protein
MRLLSIIALLVLYASAFGQGPPRVMLEGKVTAPDGKPVAGALVSATYEWRTSTSSGLAATTAADGTFKVTLANPEDPRSIRVAAYAKGYSNAKEIKANARDKVTLVMRPAIDFTVQIVDSAKLPVKTAMVTIAKDSFSTTHPLVGIPQRVDAHGKVTFKGVNDGDFIDLTVKAPGYLEVTWPHVPLAQPFEIEILRGAILRARLLDHATGAAVQACRVFVGMGQQTTTDPKGNFAVGVPYGRISVFPQCDDYGIDHDLGIRGLTIDFTETGASQLHVVRARKNQVVRVRVVDAKGKPIAKVNVHRALIPPDPNDIAILRHGPPQEYELTDDAGEAVFRKSSMDRFTLDVEGYTVSQDVRFADVRGTIIFVAK